MNRYGNALKSLLVLGAASNFSASAFTPVSLHASNSKIQQRGQNGLFAIHDDMMNDSMMTARQARIMSPLAGLLAFNLQVPKAFAAEEELDDGGILSSKKFKAAVKKYFSGASTSSDVTLRVARALRERGYNERNTLLGASLCSDEINDTPVSLINALQSKLLETRDGGVFNLGGLGGLPFVGTSGFGAFTSHCPESGKVLIIFGPHVGVSNDGVVGKVERVGKENPSTSCGAAVGAYKAIAANQIPPIDAPPGSADFQEEFIIANLKRRLSNLAELEKGGNDAAVAYVTDQMYDIIWEIMRGEVEAFTTKQGFWDKVSEVTLLGGIVVNRGHGDRLEGGDDLFQPLIFTTVDKTGETNIYQEVFGDLPTPRQRVLSGFNQNLIPQATVPPPELTVEKKPAPVPAPVVAPAPVAVAPAPAPAPVVVTPPPAPVIVAPPPAPSSTAVAPEPTKSGGSPLDNLPQGVIPAALGVLGAGAAVAAFANKPAEMKMPPAAIPTITGWRKNPDGSITGFVYGSPNYRDGDDITTSPLSTKAKADTIVTTSTGSRYYLESSQANPAAAPIGQGTVAVSAGRARGGDSRMDALERSIQNMERRSALLEDENARLREVSAGIKDLASRL